ncbi:nitroreductase family protein [Advenella kashmirensis]
MPTIVPEGPKSTPDTLFHIRQRKSSRALSGEPVTEEKIHALFDAARRAPSAYNSQPWRFLYAKKGTPMWKTLLVLLNESNQIWAQQASLLILILSYVNDPVSDKALATHSFDTGAAWQNMALQGCAMNLVVHAMRGLDIPRAHRTLNISEALSIEAMVAVGPPGDPSKLPTKLQEKEIKSGRLEVSDIAFENTIPSSFKS